MAAGVDVIAYDRSNAGDVYSTIDTAATAVTTPSAHCGLRSLSALDDAERLEGVDDATVTFRSGCVGSMFGVTDTWNMGGRGEPSNWYKLR